MLNGGARWAVERGYGERADLERVEEGGQMKDARPEAVSDRAKARMRDEVGTLGSGNHYLEVQEVAEVHDAAAARGLRPARGRRGGLDPLRLARPRPPDRHRGTARDARRGPPPRHRAPRPRAGLRARALEGGRALPRRDARGHQRRPRQPAGAHAPRARGVLGRAALVGPDAAVRRLAQHLQGRAAPRGRPASARSTSTARARRAPGAPATPACPTGCARWASRSSSAARWARAAGSSPAPRPA